MAYLDQGIGEAYVSPQIEATLGFSQKEWLEDPVRWYHQIHPDDKDRWSNEAAEMFLSGKPLRSSYRVMARDGRVVWFHCEARLVRRDDGEPWFIHGVGFDITELKQVQEALAGRAQCRLGDFRYRGRAGRGAGSGRADRALQPRLRADDRLFGRRIERQVCLGSVRRAGGSRRIQEVVSADSRQACAHRIRKLLGDARRQAAGTLRGRPRCLPGTKQTPPYIIASGIDVTEQTARGGQVPRPAGSRAGRRRGGESEREKSFW